MFTINSGSTATGNLSFGLFVLPMGAALGMSRTQFGWVQTTRSLGAGLSSYIVGRLLDRYGPRVVIVVAATVVGACVFGIARINSAWQFMVLFGIIGITGLAAPVSLMTTVPVARWFRRRRGRALAIAFMGGGAAGIVLMPVTQLLIDQVGWRTTWTILAVIFITLTIPAAALFLRRSPEDMGLTMDGDPVGLATASTSAEQQGGPEATWTVREALCTSALWKLMLVFSLGGVAMGGTMVHRIPYWVEERGFDAQLVSFAFSADTAAAATMGLVAGVLLDRMPVRIIGTVFYLGFVIAMSLTLMGWNELFLFSSATINGMAIGCTMVMQAYVFAAYYGSAFLGAIRGVVMPLTMVSVAIGPPLAGYLRDETGSYQASWWMITVIYVAAALVMSTITPPKRRQQPA